MGKFFFEIVELYEKQTLPCPFCGSETIRIKAEFGFDYDEYFVQCQTCAGAGGAAIANNDISKENAIESAVKHWNSRVK